MAPTRRHIWHLTLSAYTWLLLAVLSIAGFLVLVPVAILTRPFDPTRRIAGTVFRRTARTIAQLTPLWRFAALPPYPKALQGAYVVIANHESFLDPFLLTFLPYEMKWLAKRSLFWLPFIGWSMALAGDVGVVRGRGRSIDRAMVRCRQILAQGMPVFIFPEGTRAVGESLQPFKDGAFRLALEAGCPILPLALTGTARGMVKNSLRFSRSDAALKVGTPIITTALREQIADPKAPMDHRQAVTLLREAARLQVATMRQDLCRQFDGLSQGQADQTSGR